LLLARGIQGASTDRGSHKAGKDNADRAKSENAGKIINAERKQRRRQKKE